MANVAGLVAGIVLTVGGAAGIIAAATIIPTEGKWILGIYAVIALALGIALLANQSKEDTIEQIKKVKQ